MKTRICALAFLALAAAACGTEGDGTVGGVDRSQPNVIRVGSGFGSVGFACHGTVGVYVTADDVRATSALAVVPGHEACPPPTPTPEDS